VADPADARRARLHLTTKARTIDRRSAGTIEAAVRRTLASLPAHEVDAAGHVLAALAETLNNTSGAPVRRSGTER
jgi:DNA-binding MarR family transcriptional regulator